VDFWELIDARASVRQFSAGRDVSIAEVELLLGAAVRAPSAGNRQPWHFCVVRDPQVKQALAAAAYGQSFVAQAPVVIVVCTVPARSAARYGQRGTDLYCLQDTAAAAEHLLLAAVALGLGGCWVGAFDEDLAAEALTLSRAMRPVALIPIGQPAAAPKRRTERLPLSEVTTFV
jgi:nitroreductase